MFSLGSQKIDFLAIGDITTDAFIRLRDASVHCKVDTNNCEICLRFADKVPFESITVVKGVGNSPNAAVSASRLLLKSALVAHVGDDQNGHDCIAELHKNSVSTKYVTREKGKKTNYHYAIWYEADRTILVNHIDYDNHLPKISEPKWIYLSSIGGGESSFKYHLEIIDYLKHHPHVKLAFQPGTFQMKVGVAKFAELYSHTEVFVVNVEESQRILGREEKGFISNEDIRDLLRSIHELGPKIVHITDGPKGSYMYDGDHFYFMPIYPDPKPPLERTGCGDAYASTFVVSLIQGYTPLEALLRAPINPMSVVQHVGAQEGLLGKGQIEELLKNAPVDYAPREI